MYGGPDRHCRTLPLRRKGLKVTLREVILRPLRAVAATDKFHGGIAPLHGCTFSS